MKQLRWLLLFFLLLTGGLNCLARDSRAADREEPAARILAFAELPEFRVPSGEIIYARYCTFCHGAEGKGDGLNAFSIPKRPANLQIILADRTAKEINETIVSGGGAVNKSAQMPSFGQTLSARQLTVLRQYLREKIQQKL